MDVYWDYNPSGKRPMIFLQIEGQIPIDYNNLNAGRPATDNGKPARRRSGYLDLPKGPEFAFGYGMRYATFAGKDLKLNKQLMNAKASITV